MKMIYRRVLLLLQQFLGFFLISLKQLEWPVHFSSFKFQTFLRTLLIGNEDYLLIFREVLDNMVLPSLIALVNKVFIGLLD